MENQIPDGKKFIHFLQIDGACSPARHLGPIENAGDSMSQIFLTCPYETKVGKIAKSQGLVILFRNQMDSIFKLCHRLVT